MTWDEYEAFVRRAAATPLGRRVKQADMPDNSNLLRIANPTERDFDRLVKYRRALALLESLPPLAT